MPKFLDAPSWYSPTGVLLNGVGVNGNPGNGQFPVYKYSSERYDKITLQINGGNGYFNSGYAKIWTPEDPGDGGEVLVSNGTGLAPFWGALKWQYIDTATESTGISVLDNTQTVKTGSSTVGYIHNLSISGSDTTPGNAIKIYVSIYSSSYSTNVSSYNNVINLISSAGLTSTTYAIPATGTYQGRLVCGIFVSVGKLIVNSLNPVFG